MFCMFTHLDWSLLFAGSGWNVRKRINHLKAMVTLSIYMVCQKLYACAQLITGGVATVGSCFVLVRTHQPGIARGKGVKKNYGPHFRGTPEVCLSHSPLLHIYKCRSCYWACRTVPATPCVDV